MKIKFYLAIVIVVLSIGSCRKTESIGKIPDLDERYKAGGATTVYESGFFSFDNPAPNLSPENLATHLDGDAQFEAVFVTAPASINPGVGAQFNNTSCIACHPKDGRAGFPEDDINSLSGFFLRVSIPGVDEHGGPKHVPGYGDQLQNHAVYGKQPEVKYKVTYEDIVVKFTDGTTTVLKKPIYSVTDTYIPMPANAMFSPRIGPAVYGLGLLDAIPEADILAREDISDADGDGISGKANRVWDPESNSMKLGRFGWKANTPSVMVQSAGAYHGDMGVTNYLFPSEADLGQTNGEQNDDDDPEITDEILDQVALYCRTLAVPAARNLDDPQVRRGYQLFEEANCAKCHVPRQVTGTFPGIPAISNQVIYPYTDMLLHDMGINLADGRPDFLADGNEWRTRDLWGIGLFHIVNGHTNLLHDGRAKSIEEAILWHGGEAQNSQDFYRNLSKDDRDALVKFVESI